MKTTTTNKVTNGDLVVLVANATGLTKEVVKQVLSQTVATITDTVVAGGTVNITGLATVCSITRKPKTINNPLTGKMHLPASKGIKFKPSTALRHKVRDSK